MAGVLVVGAGGLGSPAALYLAAAGIGRLGIVDYDKVELDNLHRQVLHTEARVGESKVESALKALRQINSGCEYRAYDCLLDWENALKIIPDYDIVLDGSDNAPTRYLLNDICVLLGKPLVSGAALRFDGQLTTYNYHGSACYRCVHPRPPPPEAVVNCQFGGVLGPVTGTIGSLQALEAIRILAMGESNYAGKMLRFDGLTGSLRIFKLRGRKPNCVACGEHSILSPDVAIDYEEFCGSKTDDKCQILNILEPQDRIAPRRDLSRYSIIDVRPSSHFDISRLPEAINIPIDECAGNVDRVKAMAAEKDILVVCRAGNDSQRATKMFRDGGIDNVVDMIGGMNAYASTSDTSLPRY